MKQLELFLVLFSVDHIKKILIPKTNNILIHLTNPEAFKLFKIFCLKDTDYVMKKMAISVTFDELDGARKRRYFIDRIETKDTKQFTYRQPFGDNIR